MRRRPGIPIKEFRNFVSIVRRLRRDCPWDRKQTHRSLRHGLIEETYEVIEALDGNDLNGLRHELGDLLLHIALHATIAEEAGEFSLRDLLSSASAKLVRLHPHVFGNARARSAEEVRKNWEQLKLQEGRTSVLEGVPRHLPALQKALRIQQRAATVGFDWTDEKDVWAKVREELEELRGALRKGTAREKEEEFGDLLFALVNYGRFVDVHPEDALRHTIDKFTRRFRYIETVLAQNGKDIHSSTLKEMDAIWNEAKRKLGRGPRKPAAGKKTLTTRRRHSRRV